jgi:predicted MFS family arabinose efflux permease
LLTGGLGLLVFALIEGRDAGWGSVTVLGAFALSAAAVAAFVVHESRHPAPLVDLGLLRQRAFLGGNLAALTLYGMLTGAAVYVSIFLQQVQGRSAIQTGLCQLPQGALIMACAPLTSRLAARVGLRLPIVIGMLTAAAGFAGLLSLDAHASLLEPTLAFGVAGLGAGLALPSTTVIALSATPPASAGMASAIHQTCRQMGQTLAVAVLGTILFARVGGAGRNGPLVGPAAADYVHGLHAALTAAVIALLAGAGIAAVLIGSRVSLDTATRSAIPPSGSTD